MSQWSIWAVLLLGTAVLLGLWKITGDRQCWLWLILPVFLLWGYDCCGDTLERQEQEHLLVTGGYEALTVADTEVAAIVQGRITKLTEREERMEYLLEDVVLSLGDRQLRLSKLLVYLPFRLSAVEGDRIQAEGTLDCFDRPTNPGQFDYAAYQASLGVNLLMNGSEATVIVPGERKLAGWLGNLRRAAVQVYVKVGGEAAGGTMAALVLGDKTYLSDERYQLYLDSGIGHILTLSGLHLSVFGVGLYGILRKRLTLPVWPSAILMITGICGYVGLIGGGISAARAAIALGISLLGGCLGKTYDSLSAAALGMICILTEYPLQITRPSFWLSFGAVFAMGGLVPLLNGWLKPQRKLTRALIPVMAIQLALMPVTAVNQYVVQTYSIVLNMIVVPMMGLLLGGSIEVLFVGLIGPGVASWLAILIDLAFQGIDWLCRLSLSLPGSQVPVGMPSVIRLLGYGVVLSGLIAHIWRENQLDWRKMETVRYQEEEFGGKWSQMANCLPGGKGEPAKPAGMRRRWIGLLLVSALLVSLLAVKLGGNTLSITFLDVGQGDCICIETPGGTTILVDGGSTSASAVGEYRIKPYLEWAGISRLDYVVLTHLDLDHVSGVEELLLSDFPIGTVLISSASIDEEKVEEIKTLVEESNTKVVEICSETRLICGKVEIECIYPLKISRPESENEASIVLQLTYGRFSCLLTGDLEGDGEDTVTEALTGTDPVTLLKVAHHGSKYSTDEGFLEVTAPAAAVISCGKNNFYGHPHEELLDRLRAVGCEIYCTAECGAVLVETDGERWKVDAWCDNTY